MGSIAAAMRLFESGDVAGAERAFAALADASRDGVIARFRRAECLSRLGRHEDAVEGARAAQHDGSAEPAPWVWLAHCLAEAGRTDEIASIPIPAAHTEELAVLRDGYAALTRLARDDRGDAQRTTAAILDTRHAPLYSLALRIAEARRLTEPRRWPDLPSVWYAHECRMELEETKKKGHPAPPTAATPAKAVRWLKLHWSCADYADLVRSLRTSPRPPEGLDECELEQHLACGRIDAAAELADRLARDAGEDAAGELAVDRARIAQLRGEPARPSQFAGFDDARTRLASFVAWLDLGAALLEERTLDARALADRVADPSHREYVEAALLRWGAT
jgi:hypothetical protein